MNSDDLSNSTVMTPPVLAGCEAHLDALRAVGREFHQRGWSLGTSSNYSVVLSNDPLELLVTASGMDKSSLRRGDFVRVNADGVAHPEGQPRSSAETLLHVVAAHQAGVGAVLHTHSIWATLLSDFYAAQGCLEISGYEMLKGLAGVRTHQHTQRLLILNNTQDIPALADQVRRLMHEPEQPLSHGYLIRKHGMYTWGRDLSEARRHVEILEFLLECEGRRLMLAAAAPAAGPVIS